MDTVKLLRQLSDHPVTGKERWVRTATTLERRNGRIFFFKSPDELETPFPLRPTIKSMQGYRWHGHRDLDESYMDGHKVWSCLDSCRNNFNLEFLMGGNPYAPWEKPLVTYQYERPLRAHQELMSNHCLTYHYKILAAEMGTGKTLSAIEVMEKSLIGDWWWVAPRSALNAVEREFVKWGLRVSPNLMTYDKLRTIMKNWKSGDPAPQGVIFDESSRLKGPTSQRTKAAQALADAIRAEWGWDGYVILMSGTPAPKAPIDWWAQCEVCYPGFIKEGEFKAFHQRLRIFEKKTIDGSTFHTPVAWRDDEGRCDVCGQYMWVENEEPEDIEREGRWKLDCDGGRLVHPNHNVDPIFGTDGAHEHVPSKNEVAFLHQRLDGLVLPLKKKDCWDLPDKQYREVILEPSTTIKRVAKALLSTATTAIQGITWLRELSDGFQYKSEQCTEKPMTKCPVCKGEGECEQWFFDGEEISNPDPADMHEEPLRYDKRMATCEKCEGSGEVENMVRTTKEIRCPKEQAVRDLLEENEDQGRLVIFAGFRGSIDRVVRICHKQQWDVVRVDGRGWKVLKADGNHPTAKSSKPLDFWADLDKNPRVVFVAHPESGGMGLTLTESRMAVFYSNDFKPESRQQAEDRIHRPGIDENKGATIVDLFHLGSDRKVLNVLRDNRRLEQMTLGELQELEL